MTLTVPLSAFTRAPRRAIELLDQGDVVLTRENAPSLRLSLVPDNAEVEHDGEESADAPSPPAATRTSPLADAEELVLALAGYVGLDTIDVCMSERLDWYASLPPAVSRLVLDDVGHAVLAEDVGELAQVMARWRVVAADFAE